MPQPGNLPMSFCMAEILRRAVFPAEEYILMKRIIRSASALVLAVSMLLSLVACSTGTTTQTEKATTESVAEVSESVTESVTESVSDIQVSEESVSESVSEAVFPMTYEDFYGDSVVIEEKPSKVISISPTITEIIYALGLEGVLTGRSNYCDYPAEVLSIQTYGNIDTPDIESIVEAQPDIVIASSIFSEDSFNQLTVLGIPVILVRSEESFDGLYDVIADVAMVLGETQKGEELIASMKAQLDELDVPEITEDSPSVYYCMSFGEYGDYTAGEGTFIDDMIGLVGAVNAGAGAENWVFSAEALIEADPDYIIVPEWGYEEFISTEPYASLSAVVEGRVIPVDNNLFERQGPRNIDAVLLIYDAIY